jgi:hypothetical protein
MFDSGSKIQVNNYQFFLILHIRRKRLTLMSKSAPNQLLTQESLLHRERTGKMLHG